MKRKEGVLATIWNRRDSMNDNRKNRTIAVLQTITAMGFILFWIGVFTIGLAPENPPKCYFVFEHSFPLPDVVLAVALFISAIFVLRKNPLGRVLSLISAGALVFLGLLDFSFNYQNGVCCISTLDFIMNACINACYVAFGLSIILHFSKTPTSTSPNYSLNST
jgi:energy-coupling factor transporter transmembrane protein EcfT